MKLIIFAAVLALALAQSNIGRPARPHSDSLNFDHTPYFLPADTELYLEEPEVPSYICGEPGIHADIENNCQIFHICDEKAFDPSQPDNKTMLQYSFVCPVGTRFDQSVQVCTPLKDAIECQSSPAFYPLNEKIGNIEAAIHEIGDLLAREDNAPGLRGNKLSLQLDQDREWGNYGNYAGYQF